MSRPQALPFPSEPRQVKAGRLWVTERYACFEGEGRTLGALSFLIRLSGCNLRCWWCDSKQSSFFEHEASEVSIAQLEREALASGAAWVSFTGGEPTWRPEAELKDLAKLCARLRAKGLKTKIETNGLLLPQALRQAFDLWSVAPKWDLRAKAPKPERMRLDAKVLGALGKAYAPQRLQLKFVITGSQPSGPDLAQACKILKAWRAPKPPVFFIPEAYASGDYVQRCRLLEAALQQRAKVLKGWDLRVQPQWHRVVHGDARGK